MKQKIKNLYNSSIIIKILLFPFVITYQTLYKLKFIFDHILVIKFEIKGLMLKKGIPEYNNIKYSNKKTAFATVVTDGFVPALGCLLFSLLKHNPYINFDFIVIHDHQLSEKSRKIISASYSNVKYYKPNVKNYKNVIPHERLGKVPYYGIECFNFKEYDKIIYFDGDLLCKGSIDELINSDADFGACLDVGASIVPRKIKKSKNYIFNTGVLVIGKKYINNRTYKELLELVNNNVMSDDPALNRFCDQRIMNIYFSDKKITYLSLSYNVLKKLKNSYLKFKLNRAVLIHYVGQKPWNKLDPEYEMKFLELNNLWRDYYGYKKRLDEYKNSEEIKNILKLKNKYKGKRCFILGNGPSLKNQDLTLLKDEYTFVTNWFALYEKYDKIDPNFYCICSHTIFGGWRNPDPKIDENLYKLLYNKTKKSVKFFSFRFKDYIKKAKLFKNHKLNYLLFESGLKKFVERKSSFNLDPERPIDDGHTAVITFCMFLANLMGFKEIYLLGCDCDYGIKKEKDEKKYFYKSKLHTSKTSSFKHLKSVWRENGPIFESYRIAYEALKENGIKVYNATHGGRLEVFERVKYEDIIKK